MQEWEFNIGKKRIKIKKEGSSYKIYHNLNDKLSVNKSKFPRIPTVAQSLRSKSAKHRKKKNYVRLK